MVCLIAFSVYLILFGKVPRNLLIFLRNSSENNCDLNAALLMSQHFLVENFVLFFFNLLEVSEHLPLCYQSQVSCVDFPDQKLSIMK